MTEETSVGSFTPPSRPQILWGTRVADSIPQDVLNSQYKRVYLSISRSINRTNRDIGRLKKALGMSLVGVFDKWSEHTPLEIALEMAADLRDVKADLLISVGGGTIIDGGKIAQLILSNDAWSVLALSKLAVTVDNDGKSKISTAKQADVMHWAVPTTLSGAEYSDVAGGLDSSAKLKRMFQRPALGPRVVYQDAQLACCTPAWLWCSTGVRAIDHAVESVCSIAPIPLVDACALHGLALLYTSLKRSHASPRDLIARQHAFHGAWLASQGIMIVPYGASHGIGHALGAVASVSHGYTSCVLLPAVMEWNAILPSIATKQKMINHALGGAVHDSPIELIRKLIESLNLPTRIRSLGVPRDKLSLIAQSSWQDPWVRSNPRPIRDPRMVCEILEYAY